MIQTVVGAKLRELDRRNDRGGPWPILVQLNLKGVVVAVQGLEPRMLFDSLPDSNLLQIQLSVYSTFTQTLTQVNHGAFPLQLP